MKAQINAEHIFQVGMGFWASKALLAAIKLGVFSTLNGKALSADELSERVGMKGRGARDLLDTLVSLHFLQRRGDGEQSRYSNTPESATFLNRCSSRYIGGFLEMANDRLYPYWAHLEEALCTGKPQNEIKHNGRPFFEELYEDEAKLRKFIEAMAAVQMENFQLFAEKVDFSPYSTVCDVGGAGAALSIVLANRYARLNLINFDLPAVENLAREAVQAAGLMERIKLVSGDFFVDDLPAADVILMGNILHDWNENKKQQLIQKAYRALPDGGALMVLENMIDDQRRQNTFALLMSLNMLIEVGDGFNFSTAEFQRWAAEAGFQRSEYIPLTPVAGVIRTIK